MIVAHVGEYASGGITTYLKTLITQQILDDNISKIYVFISDFNSEKLIFESDKVSVIRYPYRRSVVGIFHLLSLWHQIVKKNVDVLHLHSSFAGLMRLRYLFASVRIKNNMQIVYCPHGWSFTRSIGASKKHIYAMLEKILAKIGNSAIINISQSEQNAAIEYGLSRQQMTVVPNAIFYPKKIILKKEHQGKNFLFVGRFDQQKGIDILLEAAAELENEAHFKVVGSQVLDDTVMRNAQPSNVELLGWMGRNEIFSLYEDVDALIVPSRWEGFGLVTLEAMSQNTAVIASRVGGLKDIVQEGYTGMFFEPENVEDLVSVIRTVNKSQLSVMGMHGREYLEAHYNPEDMERQIYKVYTQTKEG